MAAGERSLFVSCHDICAARKTGQPESSSLQLALGVAASASLCSALPAQKGLAVSAVVPAAASAGLAAAAAAAVAVAALAAVSAAAVLPRVAALGTAAGSARRGHSADVGGDGRRVTVILRLAALHELLLLCCVMEVLLATDGRTLEREPGAVWTACNLRMGVACFQVLLYW